jgi:hypothetical protein
MATTTIGVQSRSHGGALVDILQMVFSLQIDCRVFYQVKNVISPKFYGLIKGVLLCVANYLLPSQH